MPPLLSGRPTASRLLPLVAAVLLGACQSADAPIPVARVVVSGITGVTDSVTVGDSRPLVVVLSDANGGVLTGRDVTWTSGDNAVATVTGAGVLTAVAPGRTTVTAASEGRTGEITVTVRRKPVASVAVDRAVDTLWLGRTKTLRAQPRDAAGGSLTGRVVAWTVGDTTLLRATPVADGTVLLRAAALGATQVEAVSEGVRTAMTMIVVPVPVATLTLTVPDTVKVGRTVALRVAATAPDGTTLTSADLAGRSVTWGSDRVGVITVAGLADAAGSSPSGFTATARGVGAGNATIAVAIDGASARSTMQAARAAVTRVEFPTSTVSLRVGDATTIGVSATDADGLAVPGAPLQYTIAIGTNVVRLTPATLADGTAALRLEGIAAGSATVVGTVDGRTASLAVTVTEGGAVLRAYPTSITAAPGAIGRLSSVLLDAAGKSSTAAVTWRSTNPAVMSVDENGRVSAVAPGTASVTARTTSGQTATIPVTVATPPASAFHIEIIPVGDVPQAVRDAALQAAARWERVITAALPSEQLDLLPNDCDAGTPAVSRYTSGIVVYLLSRYIDGSRGTLAWAGPCAVRDKAHGGLTIAGAMTVDQADVALLTGSSGALALDVLTHELGHVLGIGIPEVWNGTPAGRMVFGTDAELRFTGASASAASVAMGATASVSEGVPIEDTGGLGTAGGHWRERVFYGELMTGWVGVAPNPLSVVTVHALRDIGYGVTEMGADIVSPVSISGGITLRARAPLPSDDAPELGAVRLGEKILTPKFVVGGGRTQRKQ